MLNTWNAAIAEAAAHEADAAPGPGRSAWRRLCPHDVWSGSALERIEQYLSRPQTLERLCEYEREEGYPEEILQELGRLGMRSIFSGEEGAEGAPDTVTPYHICALAALSARVNGSLAITLGVNGLALLPAYIAGTPDQLRYLFGRFRAGALVSLLLTEPDKGSNLLRSETYAEAGTLGGEGEFRPTRQCPTHYRLAGHKHLINGATRHDLMVVFARTGGAAADWRAAMGDFSLFFFERDATVEPSQRWRTHPVQSADIADVRLNNTVIPAENRLGAEGGGFLLLQRALMIARLGISALGSGAATLAWDQAYSYAHERRIYGTPIASLGAIAEHLAHIRALDILIAAMSIRATAATNCLGCGAAYYTAVAKFVCCFLAEEAVDEGRRILSSRALLRGTAYEQLIRDVRLYGVFDGTLHLMLDQISAQLAKTTTHSADAADELAAKRFLSEKPRSLIATSRQFSRIRVGSLAEELRLLSALATGIDVRPLMDVARALEALVRHFAETQVWQRDQAVRFACARCFAFLESVTALLELVDPGVREAWGIRSDVGEDDVLAYEYAASWIGFRIVSEARYALLSAGAAASPQGLEIENLLDQAEKGLLYEQGKRLMSLTRIIGSGRMT